MAGDGRMEVVRELCSFEGRLTGTDAERQAANRLAERLRALGRRAEVEPTYVHPQVGLVYAAHCLIALAGSLAGVAIPALGFGLVLVAATSMYLDLNARLYLLRLLFFRRASQNVVSPGARPQARARLLLSAHYDAARTGAAFAPRRMRVLAAAQRRLGFVFSPSRLLFWSVAALLPLLGARMAGIDAAWISVLQLPPTLVVLVALFAFVDIALSPVVPGANDNASGVATALSLAAELDRDPPRHLDVWVLLTGGEECLAQGMRAFLREHRGDLDPSSTYLVNLDSVGAGEVRFEVGEGPTVTYALDSRLTQLCAAIAEADAEGGKELAARPLVHGFLTDALPARHARIPATTITCLEPAAAVPANYHTLDDVPDALDPAALERAHDFALALIRAVDRDLARTTAAG
ncbi:MAG: M28 family metallopeptidase [Solirubrobacterales bacterium]